MAYTTPIIDRTQADVLYAISNQNAVADLKGALNVSDVNRIINNSIYLRDLLEENGFYADFTDQTLFTQATLPHIHSKIDIIKDNINLLVTSFYQFNNPVLHYGNILDYADVNAMEENLKITNDLISALILELRLCGYTTCGEDINL